jgi:hypothetical protein
MALMKLALLGADDDSLRLVRWAVASGEHTLVAAVDSRPRTNEIKAIAPHIRFDEQWESLLVGSTADAVIVGRAAAGMAEQTGIADDERRAEQLRKLAQAAVPMVVVCPACEAIVGFEIDMIRRDVAGTIIPYVPGTDHPALRSLEGAVGLGDNGSLGTVEQITFEREQIDRSRSSVLVQFARDVGILRQIIGPIVSVSATGPATAVGRDPLGPKVRELPSLANLGVCLIGKEGLTARWSVGPASGTSGGRLTVIGHKGKAVLKIPEAGDWSLETSSSPIGAASFDSHDGTHDIFWRLSHSASTAEFRDEESWLAACRDQEVAEAVDRSLARGRTIELFHEEHSEEQSFKGVMAMGGCLILLFAIGLLMVASVVEGLRLPIRGWPLWRAWPFLLLAPIVVFLLLQLLRFIAKDSGGRRAAT